MELLLHPTIKNKILHFSKLEAKVYINICPFDSKPKIKMWILNKVIAEVQINVNAHLTFI